MDFLANSSFGMWFMLLVTVGAVIAFVRERVPLEVTSIILLTILLLYGQVFPVENEDGRNLLDAQAMLAGFANPSLIAVLALLVIGQAMIQTDSLRFLTNLFVSSNTKLAWISIFFILVFVMVISAVMNNTPLVIIAIPIMQALLQSIQAPASRIMMPLSFVAILGGMTTLIGSSTNLLVSSSMVELGYKPLGFFDFTVPGVFLAGAGFLFVLIFVPRMLPGRQSMTQEIVGDEKEFVAELDIMPDSKLIGSECVEGKFASLGNMNIKLIQRAGHLILPPFEGAIIQEGDILIVAATRETLGSFLSKYPGYWLSEDDDEEDKKVSEVSTEEGDDKTASVETGPETRVLAKIMITPASRMIDMSLDHVNFQKQYGAIVLGIQRRARVVRRRLGRIRLEAGDVLLIAGKHSAVNNMRDNTDFIVLSGSKKDLPVPGKAPVAIAVFITTIGLAAGGILSIPVAAFAGAASMIGLGCLNIRQATRAIDRKIFLLVGSMLALGAGLQVTGGANFIASQIMHAPFADSPLWMASLLFLIVAFTTNILTNNACAILFTPIAMKIAESFPHDTSANFDLTFIFAVTVVFAANCSFASPIGYQTNLLIMGPGQYRFRDFIKAGVPLVVIIWITYTIVAKYYFGL